MPKFKLDRSFLKYYDAKGLAKVTPILDTIEAGVNEGGVWNVDLNEFKFVFGRSLDHFNEGPVHRAAEAALKKHGIKIKRRKRYNREAGGEINEIDTPEIITECWGLSQYVHHVPTAIRRLNEYLAGKNRKLQEKVAKARIEGDKGYFYHPEGDDKWIKTFIKDFLEPLSTVAEMLEEAKKVIKLGRKVDPNAVKKEVYQPPMSALKDLKMVDDLIKALLKEWYPKQVAFFTKMYIEGAENLIPFVNKEMYLDPYTQKKAENPYENWWRRGIDQHYASFLVVKPKDPRYESDKSKHKAKLVPGYKARAKKQAIATVEKIQADFSRKQQAKLTSIIAERGALKEGIVVHIDDRIGHISGDIKFTFKDGAEFTVRNNIVSVTNSHGTFFHRYPTTFHQIKKGPKAHVVAKESEKWMNEEFA